MEKMILDCANLDSAIRSVCQAFNCKKDDIYRVIHETDLDSLCSGQRQVLPPQELLFHRFSSRFGGATTPASVAWFHLTRTWPGNAFEQGILPLGQAIDAIWERLIKLFVGTKHYSNLKKYRLRGPFNCQYRLKVNSVNHQGPYAMLVRDSAFCPTEIGNHDYLHTPEIVEDICKGYGNAFKCDIQDYVASSWRPCIVEFISSKRTDRNCLEAAVFYVYCRLRQKKLSDHANTCFDGEGHPVPYCDILQIEYCDCGKQEAN
jgi:hypothetical protein